MRRATARDPAQRKLHLALPPPKLQPEQRIALFSCEI